MGCARIVGLAHLIVEFVPVVGLGRIRGIPPVAVVSVKGGEFPVPEGVSGSVRCNVKEKRVRGYGPHKPGIWPARIGALIVGIWVKGVDYPVKVSVGIVWIGVVLVLHEIDPVINSAVLPCRIVVHIRVRGVERIQGVVKFPAVRHAVAISIRVPGVRSRSEFLKVGQAVTIKVFLRIGCIVRVGSPVVIDILAVEVLPTIWYPVAVGIGVGGIGGAGGILLRMDLHAIRQPVAIGIGVGGVGEIDIDLLVVREAIAIRVSFRGIGEVGGVEVMRAHNAMNLVAVQNPLTVGVRDKRVRTIGEFLHVSKGIPVRVVVSGVGAQLHLPEV